MDRVVEPGTFRIMVGGSSPEYTAADRIKNSVGFRSAAKGVNDSLEYTSAYKANFVLEPGALILDTLSGKKMAPVTVTNQGNLTDVGKLAMYVNGVQQGDLHHFELAPGVSKTIFFPLAGSGGLDCIFTTKYRSAVRQYAL
jgi:beta-glucosidase